LSFEFGTYKVRRMPDVICDRLNGRWFVGSRQ
jgi:hypothetical protein